MTTWRFEQGVKILPGNRRVPLVGTRNYLSSNGNTVYTVSEWADGTASCNCPGWSQRVDKRTGERSCKHARGEQGQMSGLGRQVTIAPPLRGAVADRRPSRLVGSED